MKQMEANWIRAYNQLLGNTARLDSLETIGKSTLKSTDQSTKSSDRTILYHWIGALLAVTICFVGLVKLLHTKKPSRRRMISRQASTSSTTENGCDGSYDDSDEHDRSFGRRLTRSTSKKLSRIWPCSHKEYKSGHYSAFFGQSAARLATSQKASAGAAADTASASGCCNQELEVGGFGHLGTSDTSGCDMTSVKSLDDCSINNGYQCHTGSSTAKSLTSLANRLTSLLQSHTSWSSQRSMSTKQPSPNEQSNENQSSQQLQQQPEVRGTSSSTMNSIDENNNNNNSVDKTDDDDTLSQCRSSRSYIKSLVDVLSNARNQLPSHHRFMASSGSSMKSNRKGQFAVGDDDDDDDFNDVTDKTLLVGKSSSTAATYGDDFDEFKVDPDTQMLAQMDISAAHLILSYMEKHLDDKERLRREWDELNSHNITSIGDGCKTGGKNNAQNNNNKFNKLLIEKRAQIALSRENRAKNRSPRVVPFDKNRVKLNCGSKLVGNLGLSDYINASYIYDDNPRRANYIIAQGPLESTVAQFWQMIWEQGISVIVMLTRLNENSVKMCHSYWPTQSDTSPTSSIGPNSNQQRNNNNNSLIDMPSPSTSTANQDVGVDNIGKTGGVDARRGSITSVYSGAAAKNWQQPIVANGNVSTDIIQFELPNGDPNGSTTKFEVHLVSEHVSSSDYLVRNMYIINRKTGVTRTITQFHYLAWPENGVPGNVKNFLQFRRKVNKSYRDPKKPILVHCNDGAGRSGTYTLIDMILERIKNGTKEIDPRATLEHLRDQRVGLCSTQKQFEFVLVALAEEIQLIIDSLPK